jgi:predicted RNA-binding Zn ribbon-like protein
MNLAINFDAPKGHAHDVSVDTTFDFLNTLDTDDGFPVERLPTLDVALTWFADRGLIHLEGADQARHLAAERPDAADRVIERVHIVRGALREVADAVVEHRVPRKSALAEVNRALHARQVVELVAASDGVHVDHRHVGDPVDDALARLSDALVRELTAGQPERIRICASDTCRWVFYDASRTSRRRWCDMATCGNRAKQARHRARTKAVAESDGAGVAGPTA